MFDKILKLNMKILLRNSSNVQVTTHDSIWLRIPDIVIKLTETQLLSAYNLKPEEETSKKL